MQTSSEKINYEKIWDEFNKKFSSLENIITFSDLNKYPKYQKFIISNLNFFLNNQEERCMNNFTKSLNYPEIIDFYLEIYLKLLFLFIKNKQKDTEESKIIFGIGTGRSGSTTLTHLLNIQKNTFTFHEHPPGVPWFNGENIVKFHMKRFNLLLNSYSSVADVAHWWLPYAENIIKENPNSFFLCMKRDKIQTVNSFLKIKGNGQKGSINHWIKHDGKFWSKNIWDETYPKFKVDYIQEAVGEYWEYYYSKSDEIEKKYPKNFKIFDIDELSTEQGQLNILNFCNYKHPITALNIKKNVGTVKEGRSFYKLNNEN